MPPLPFYAQPPALDYTRWQGTANSAPPGRDWTAPWRERLQQAAAARAEAYEHWNEHRRNTTRATWVSAIDDNFPRWDPEEDRLVRAVQVTEINFRQIAERFQRMNEQVARAAESFYNFTATITYTAANTNTIMAQWLGDNTTGTAATWTYPTLINGWADSTAATSFSYEATDPCKCDHAGSCKWCRGNRHRQEMARRRETIRQRQRRRAHQRGRKLLLRMLTEEQKREYARTQRITVRAVDGRTFRLRKGKTVELLDALGEVEATYCIHLSYEYVPEDNLIAQLVTLRSDPSEFEKTANITRYKKAPARPPEPTGMRIAALVYDEVAHLPQAEAA